MTEKSFILFIYLVIYSNKTSEKMDELTFNEVTYLQAFDKARCTYILSQ